MKALINKSYENLKLVNHKLLLTLLFATLLPIIYQMFRIIWVTNNGSDNYAMISFNSYLQAFEEIFTAFLILPLYSYKANDYNGSRTSIFSAIMFAAIGLFIFLSIIALPIADSMKAMNPSKEYGELYSYLFVDALSKSLTLIMTYLIAEIALSRENLKAIILTMISVLLNFILDFTLLSDLIFQSDSVLIVSVSKLISIIVMLLILVPLFIFKKINNEKQVFRINWTSMKEFYKRGLYPGIDKFIGNFFYMFVTLKIVNSLDVVGWNSWHLGMWVYWHIIFKITNVFRYSLLSETLYNERIDDRNLTMVYSFIDVLVFIILAPILTAFKLPNVIGDDKEWLHLTLMTSYIMIPFMLTMSIGDKLKVKIIAENKMIYLVWNSLISNFLIEFPVLIMLMFGWTFTFNENFGIWMAVILLSFIINIVQYWHLIRNFSQTSL